MDIVLLILLILVLLALVFLYGKWQSLALLLQDQAEDTADNLSDQLSYQLENATLKQQSHSSGGGKTPHGALPTANRHPSRAE